MQVCRGRYRSPVIRMALQGMMIRACRRRGRFLKSFERDEPRVNGRREEEGQAAGDGHHDTSSIHVHVGLVRLHAHGSHILYRVVMVVTLYRPYVCSLYITIKLDPKDRGTALSISERRASAPSRASMCMGAYRLRHSQGCQDEDA
jgi:hypothetical protein